MKRFISAGFVSIALVACGGSHDQAKDPSTTTTTNGTEPVGAGPANNDGTTNLNMHLPPSESDPSSQGTPTSTTSQGGGVTGGALADSTKMAEPNNSSDMTGGGATTANGVGTSTGAPSSTSSTDDDRRLIVKIHKALDGNSSLSQSAKNIVVQTAGGNVTLSGKVMSEREKALVEAQVAKVAGSMNVNDQLVVGK